MTTPPFGTEVGNGGLGGEQKGFDVEVEVLVDVLDGYGFEWKELIDAGVVDKDVEAAEGLGRRGDELGGFGQDWTDRPGRRWLCRRRTGSV